MTTPSFVVNLSVRRVVLSKTRIHSPFCHKNLTQHFGNHPTRYHRPCGIEGRRYEKIPQDPPTALQKKKTKEITKNVIDVHTRHFIFLVAVTTTGHAPPQVAHAAANTTPAWQKQRLIAARLAAKLTFSRGPPLSRSLEARPPSLGAHRPALPHNGGIVDLDKKKGPVRKTTSTHCSLNLHSDVATAEGALTPDGTSGLSGTCRGANVSDRLRIKTRRRVAGGVKMG